MATANELHEARRYYATQNGDGFSSHDWMGADDLIEEGETLAAQAAHMTEDDRDWFLSGKLARRSEDETHLIAVAFYARCAELTREATREGVAA